MKTLSIRLVEVWGQAVDIAVDNRKSCWPAVNKTVDILLYSTRICIVFQRLWFSTVMTDRQPSLFHICGKDKGAVEKLFLTGVGLEVKS